MKTCSKCKKDLPRTSFVKSPRYSDGMYPSCKDCRKAAKLKTLSDHPMCARCGEKPHLENRAYCYECDRIMKGRDVVPKFNRDPENKTLCSRCKLKPRLEYHRYCRECKNEATNSCFNNHGGHWAYLGEDGRSKATVRHYANGLVKAGKISKQPCVECGNPNAQIHHLDYKPRTKNISWLCKRCHDQEHRRLKSLLTEQPLLL